MELGPPSMDNKSPILFVYTFDMLVILELHWHIWTYTKFILIQVLTKILTKSSETLNIKAKTYIALGLKKNNKYKIGINFALKSAQTSDNDDDCYGGAEGRW